MYLQAQDKKRDQIAVDKYVMRCELIAEAYVAY